MIILLLKIEFSDCEIFAGSLFFSDYLLLSCNFCWFGCSLESELLFFWYWRSMWECCALMVGGYLISMSWLTLRNSQMVSSNLLIRSNKLVNCCGLKCTWSRPRFWMKMRFFVMTLSIHGNDIKWLISIMNYFLNLGWSDCSSLPTPEIGSTSSTCGLPLLNFCTSFSKLLFSSLSLLQSSFILRCIWIL